MDLFRGHLETLRIGGVAELDVLTFIYRQGTSLASADQIGRLLGYSGTVAIAALDALASSGLIQRSRNSRGVRLYRISRADVDESMQFALRELIRLSEDRGGRLQLIRLMRHTAAVSERPGRSGLYLA